jgi:ribosomal protein S18 acetylase RimI-like enzyme
MIIKQYENRYLQQVVSLHKAAMIHAGAYKGDGPWDDDLKDIQKNYLDGDGDFLIVLDTTTLVGMGAFRRITSTEAEIKRMRVNPVCQGKGIGKMILTKLETSARIKGYSSLILETSDKQIAANALYKNYGFVETRSEIIDGFNCTWYTKKLI